MTQTLVSVVLFVILLALVPFALKWVQGRTAGGIGSASSASRIVSALAVGPHQRVVTVEVGPEGARTWLTLGVTAQSITCLHAAAIDPAAGSQSESADARAPAPL
jgi:flagellar protein FliO/FliZ